ncbi:MAG: D-aminoacyl-tRNA deacylase [Ignavibacteriaceae bacterium]|jgi:D-tyrosyl-tRNA(Tyr) deacylase|nr:D-aminoacyl-tRNA deacylase [Ignavibacteriaceae bacterium]MCW8812097.1 D-aminoacyl-tRNA deacylase [Chlorobium sp.]MCW8818275.1 D-aminoacyl-tRNA deacylase [Ignavibacteriaceae bacterium]MCW8822616.1 D-aminoacyl-tRNA deacylase [Ignavibacteriaceae bacterium]MCW8959964.1 D-aminoacyl-tRNA deacylase [Ignavibacteriaceae bacterium]
MKAIVQRVKSASVNITNENYTKKIGKGLLILLGIKTGDNEEDVFFVADKCCNLRIFEDEEDKMNKSVKDVSGEILIISQFTIYGETSKGNRPSFIEAARPEEAVPLYNKFISRVKENLGEEKVKAGIFGAMMNIELINYGPVTVIVESKKISNK